MFDRPIDTQSATWRAIRVKVESRIKELLRLLERDANPEETAKLRGRITELRMFVSLIEAESAAETETQASVPFL